MDSIEFAVNEARFYRISCVYIFCCSPELDIYIVSVDISTSSSDTHCDFQFI